MNKKILSLFVFSFVLFSVAFVAAEPNMDDSADSMKVKVDILESTVSISVPDNLVIQDMAAGYISEMQAFEITNYGTTDVQVVPELSTSTDDNLFSRLGFKRIQADELIPIGFFDVEIERPSIVGGERVQNVYLQLDLTDYEDTVPVGSNNATVIFTAVPL